MERRATVVSALDLKVPLGLSIRSRADCGAINPIHLKESP